MWTSKAVIKNFLFLLFTCTLLAACGGGGGGGGGVLSGPSSMLSVITGTVSDGPIRNARVFIDINYNGRYDEEEPFSITNNEGRYKIEYLMSPGTKYLLMAEGSQELKTADPKDNPEDNATNATNGKLTFVMFTQVFSRGDKNAAPVPNTYNVDINPEEFKSYLKLIDNSTGGIDNVSVKAIIDNTSTSQVIFKELIKDKNQTSAPLKTFAAQVAEFVKYTDSKLDASATTSTTIAGMNASISFVDNASATNTNPLIKKMLETKSSTSVIGDVVVSKPISTHTVADVNITPITPVSPALTFTAKPGQLNTHNVAVTPYTSVLEIPNYSQIRDNGTIVLGADINAKRKDNLTREYIQGMNSGYIATCSDFTNLQYFYYNGTAWVDGGALSANGTTFYSAPFVIIKKNNTINKTLSLDGLSLLTDPVVVIRAYDNVTKQVVTIDALVASSGTDNVTVKLPANYIISEVVIIDNELTKTTADNKPSVTIPITNDAVNTTVVSSSISGSKTKFITNQSLYNALLHGDNVSQNFTGIGSYIDTKIAYKVADTLKNAIDAGDSLQTRILDSLDNQKASAEWTDAGGAKWKFESNKVTRTDANSEYIYSNTNTGDNFTNVSFRESVVIKQNNVQKVSVSYEGVAVFKKQTGELKSARFYQSLSEYNINAQKTHSLIGIATIENNKVSFDGNFSFYLPSYDTVSGLVSVSDINVKKGLSGSTYYNNNTTGNNSSAIFSSEKDYSNFVPSTNPVALQGIWGSTFTDNCTGQNGGLSLSITETTATWWGQSSDNTRTYGTIVEITISNNVPKLVFKNVTGNVTTVWSDNGTLSQNGQTISGNWRMGNCSGNYNLTKQQ